MKATIGMTDIKDISGHIKFEQIDADTWSIHLAGNWTQGANIKPVEQVLAQLRASAPFARLTLQAGDLDFWDSRLPTYLLAILDYCQAKNIQADLSG
ncbi:MAG TPA: hypothetical protein DCZ48_15080, partial [Methylococcaceae bacterium]|nr:hypothetical protein [Methylococcaceae bacterium]